MFKQVGAPFASNILMCRLSITYIAGQLGMRSHCILSWANLCQPTSPFCTVLGLVPHSVIDSHCNLFRDMPCCTPVRRYCEWGAMPQSSRLHGFNLCFQITLHIVILNKPLMKTVGIVTQLQDCCLAATCTHAAHYTSMHPPTHPHTHTYHTYSHHTYTHYAQTISMYIQIC